MTGYGKATAELPEKKINVEIKSLNSKAMDLSTRIAPAYREKEIEIRNEISKGSGARKSRFQPVDREKKRAPRVQHLSTRHWWKDITNRFRLSRKTSAFLSLRIGFKRCSVCRT